MWKETPRHLFQGLIDVDHLLDHLINQLFTCPDLQQRDLRRFFVPGDSQRSHTNAVRYLLWAGTFGGRHSVGAANNRAGAAGQMDLFDGLVNVDDHLHHLARQPDVTAASSKPTPFYSIASAIRIY